eukprot:UN24891
MKMNVDKPANSPEVEPNLNNRETRSSVSDPVKLAQNKKSQFTPLQPLDENKKPLIKDQNFEQIGSFKFKTRPQRTQSENLTPVTSAANTPKNKKMASSEVKTVTDPLLEIESVLDDFNKNSFAKEGGLSDNEDPLSPEDPPADKEDPKGDGDENENGGVTETETNKGVGSKINYLSFTRWEGFISFPGYHQEGDSSPYALSINHVKTDGSFEGVHKVTLGDNIAEEK